MNDPLAVKPLAALVNRRIVTWDPLTGAPVVTTRPVLTKVQVVDIVAAALTLPYEAADPLSDDAKYNGLPLLEVMLVKRAQHAAATGDTDESEALLDRFIGRPTQSTESKRINLTYEDMLREIGRQMGEPPPPLGAPRVVDVA